MTSPGSARFAAAFVICMSSFGCGATTPTEPDPPVYEQKTETYTGSLTTSGEAAFHFAVANPGNIVATITRLAPVSTLTMGLSLGFWEETTCSKQVTNSVVLNTTLTGTPSGPDEFCVAIFDVGNVQAPTEFTLTVTHY